MNPFTCVQRFNTTSHDTCRSSLLHLLTVIFSLTDYLVLDIRH